MSELEKEFLEFIDDDGYILILYNMTQDLVQDEQNPKKQQLYNMIVGSSFALYHAIQMYKENTNGKSIKYRS